MTAGSQQSKCRSVGWRGVTTFFGLGIVLGLSAGGSTTPGRRVDAHRAAYESWPIETRQAVLDGQVELDMNPDMVRIALGEPNEIVQRSRGGREEVVWIYTKVETVAPAAPQTNTLTSNARTSGVQGNNTSAPVSLPALAYRDREIVFVDGHVSRAGPKL
jgi:hypothetical protein